jgi:hypothetical protein
MLETESGGRATARFVEPVSQLTGHESTLQHLAPGLLAKEDQ